MDRQRRDLPHKPAEIHAARRLRERYGEDFSQDLRSAIVHEIKRRLREIKDSRRANQRKERNAKTLPRPSTARQVKGHHLDRRTQWIVCIDDVPYRLVYDRVDRVIVTFLPPETER